MWNLVDLKEEVDILCFNLVRIPPAGAGDVFSYPSSSNRRQQYVVEFGLDPERRIRVQAGVGVGVTEMVDSSDVIGRVEDGY